jgi:hypothetical protein
MIYDAVSTPILNKFSVQARPYRVCRVSHRIGPQKIKGL